MSQKILCIEDNLDNLYLIQKVIESLGYAFIGVSKGEIGLSVAAEEEPDLILLDINLPDLDGYEVARRIRASQNPKLSAVPIIAVTANALKGDAEKVMAAGCDVYMTKPLNIHELWSRVEAILGASGKNPDNRE